MTLIWSKRAANDLEEIGAYVALDAPHRARNYVQRLIDRATQAALFPHSGRIVPEFLDENLREIIEDKYRIVYEINTESQTVVILTVFEGHRLLAPGPGR